MSGTLKADLLEAVMGFRHMEHKAVGFPTLYLFKIVVIQIIHFQKTTNLFKNIFLESQNCFFIKPISGVLRWSFFKMCS